MRMMTSFAQYMLAQIYICKIKNLGSFTEIYLHLNNFKQEKTI